MAQSDEFAGAARELRESTVAVLTSSVARSLRSAAERSQIGQLIRQLRRDFQALPPAGRSRLVLLTVVVAVATHLLLGFLVPARFAPLWFSWH